MFIYYMFFVLALQWKVLLLQWQKYGRCCNLPVSRGQGQGQGQCQGQGQGQGQRQGQGQGQGQGQSNIVQFSTLKFSAVQLSLVQFRK